MSQHDTLHVWREHRLVGTLWRGGGERLIGFEYDKEWQATGHAISNSLPLEKRTWLPEEQTAHRWFGNLLPEEQARIALLKRLAIPDDDFALLAAIGGDCAGALQELLLADELRQALSDAGLSEHGWARLQQQRQHIRSQCNKAQRW
ncbi:HipA N-terminal domain-containing protein [Halomonas mongoliensis]|uniref:HipA N-terminal domain-containing protein n=1 Tax=Halomonas mongoliensis TaxID=321265 RepID=UPI00403AE3D3